MAMTGAEPVALLCTESPPAVLIDGATSVVFGFGTGIAFCSGTAGSFAPTAGPESTPTASKEIGSGLGSLSFCPCNAGGRLFGSASGSHLCGVSGFGTGGGTLLMVYSVVPIIGGCLGNRGNDGACLKRGMGSLPAPSDLG